MRHKGKEKIVTNRQLGIPEGIVEQRRAELIAARLVLNTALPPVPDSNEISVNPPGTSEEIIPGKALNHMTRSRPVFNHRPPSRRSPKLFDTENAGEDISEKKNESVHPIPEIDLVALIKKTILDAQTLYRNYYFLGTDSRQTPGFFTWWRHGKGGQLKADEFYLQIQNIDTIEMLLVEITAFFFDPLTHYNNHSFAPYLLDEFNKLAAQFLLPGYTLALGEAYDHNSWTVIAAQLKQLIAEDEQFFDHSIKNSPG